MGSCCAIVFNCFQGWICRVPYLELYRTVFDDFGVVRKRRVSALKRPKNHRKRFGRAEDTALWRSAPYRWVDGVFGNFVAPRIDADSARKKSPWTFWNLVIWYQDFTKFVPASQRMSKMYYFGGRFFMFLRNNGKWHAVSAWWNYRSIKIFIRIL